MRFDHLGFRDSHPHASRDVSLPVGSLCPVQQDGFLPGDKQQAEPMQVGSAPGGTPAAAHLPSQGLAAVVALWFWLFVPCWRVSVAFNALLLPCGSVSAVGTRVFGESLASASCILPPPQNP